MVAASTAVVAVGQTAWIIEILATRSSSEIWDVACSAPGRWQNHNGSRIPARSSLGVKSG